MEMFGSGKIVYNATEETQMVRVFGQWFSFKPGQTKLMSDKFATFISHKRSENGLVILPDEFADPAYFSTEEGQERLKEFKEAGTKNYLMNLRKIVKNNTQSLKQDLAAHNITTDPKVFMTDGEKHALRTLAAYKRRDADKEAAQLEELKSLEAELNLDEDF